jgi:hypothetical protein
MTTAMYQLAARPKTPSAYISANCCLHHLVASCYVMGIASWLEGLEGRVGRDIDTLYSVEQDEADQTKSSGSHPRQRQAFNVDKDASAACIASQKYQNRRRQTHLLSSSTYTHIYLLTIVLFILDITNG